MYHINIYQNTSIFNIPISGFIFCKRIFVCVFLTNRQHGRNRIQSDSLTRVYVCVTGQPAQQLAPDVDLRMMPIVSEVEYRGWPSPTWSGGGILPILATTSLSRTRKRYLANFRNNDRDFTGYVAFIPPALITRMCCSSSDVMEACASLTRAE